MFVNFSFLSRWVTIDIHYLDSISNFDILITILVWSNIKYLKHTVTRDN